MGGALQGQLMNCERYALTCYRYIELNPVRVRMVSDPADYPLVELSAKR
jgi:putative transposase